MTGGGGGEGNISKNIVPPFRKSIYSTDISKVIQLSYFPNQGCHYIIRAIVLGLVSAGYFCGAFESCKAPNCLVTPH